ncbi:hypothetical protein BJ742DRAFT_776800 [Cladochytrium replicatum]|nr:hypothetical protein BJ742DRAFT_776800 [Cladochytrium replicatum]
MATSPHSVLDVVSLLNATLNHIIPEPHWKELRATLEVGAFTNQFERRTYIQLSKGDTIIVFGTSSMADAVYGLNNRTREIGWISRYHLEPHREDPTQPNPGQSYIAEFGNPGTPGSISSGSSMSPSPIPSHHSFGSNSASSADSNIAFPSPASALSVHTSGSTGGVAANLMSALDNTTIAFSHMRSSSTESAPPENVASSSTSRRRGGASNNSSSEGSLSPPSGGPVPKPRTESDRRYEETRGPRWHLNFKAGQKRTFTKPFPKVLDRLLNVLYRKNHPDGSVIAVFSAHAMDIARQNLRNMAANQQKPWRMWTPFDINARFHLMAKQNAPQSDSQAHFLEMLLILNEAVLAGLPVDHLLEMSLSSPSSTPDQAIWQVGATMDTSVSPMLPTSGSIMPQTAFAEDPSLFGVPSLVFPDHAQYIAALASTLPAGYVPVQSETTVPVTISFPQAFITPSNREAPFMEEEKRKRKPKLKIGTSWIKKTAKKVKDKVKLTAKRTIKKGMSREPESPIEHVDMPVPDTTLYPPTPEPPSLTVGIDEHDGVTDIEYISMPIPDETMYPQTPSSPPKKTLSISYVLLSASVEQSIIAKHDQAAIMELVSESSEKIYKLFSDFPDISFTIIDVFIEIALTNSDSIRLFARILKTIEAMDVITDISNSLSAQIVSGVQDSDSTPNERAKILCAAKLYGEVYAVSAEFEIEDEEDEATYVNKFSLYELESFNATFETLLVAIEANEPKDVIFLATESLRAVFFGASRRLEWEIGNQMPDSDEDGHTPQSELDTDVEAGSADSPSDKVSPALTLSRRVITMKRTRERQESAQDAQNKFKSLFSRLVTLANSPTIPTSLRIRLREILNLLPTIENEVAAQKPKPLDGTVSRQQWAAEMFTRAVQKTSALRFFKQIQGSKAVVPSERIPEHVYALNRILVRWWDTRDVQTIVVIARSLGKGFFPSAAFLDGIFKPFTTSSEDVDVQVVDDVRRVVAALRAEGVMEVVDVTSALGRALVVLENENVKEDRKEEPSFVVLLSKLVDSGVISMDDVASLGRGHREIDYGDDEEGEEAEGVDAVPQLVTQHEEDQADFIQSDLADQMRNLTVT